MYISDMSGSGKTSCIVPAFLQLRKKPQSMWQLLYLPFFNNEDGSNQRRCHDQMPQLDSIDRCLLGLDSRNTAAFYMLRCLQKTLHGQYVDAANEKNRSRRAALVVGLVALFSFARKCWSARRVMLCFALALGACCAAFKQKVGKFLEEFIGMPSYLFPALGWVIPPSMDILERRRSQLLDALIGQGRPPEKQVLLHIDEHKKMSEDSKMRKQAMEFLAADVRVNLVATFTEPLEVTAATGESSNSTELALYKPPPDPDEVLKHKFRLTFQMLNNKTFQNLSMNAANTWAALRLLVYLQMSVRGCSFLHLPPQSLNGPAAEVNECLRTLRTAALQPDLETVARCFEQVKSHLQQLIGELRGNSAARRGNPSMTRFLLGLPAQEYSDREMDHHPDRKCKVPLVTLESGCLSPPFRYLMSTEETSDLSSPHVAKIYNQGRVAVSRALRQQGCQFQDAVGGHVLQCLYYWSLGCLLSKAGSIGDLHPHLQTAMYATTMIRQLQPGRLFKGTTTTLHDSFGQEVGVLYRADEQTCSHLSCDMWCWPNSQTLLMIEVTAGGKNTVKDHVRTLAQGMIGAEECFQMGQRQVEILGVILAPNCPMAETSCSSSAKKLVVQRQEISRQLLGGLVQVLPAMAPEQE